jgi:hypothetical protein
MSVGLVVLVSRIWDLKALPPIKPGIDRPGTRSEECERGAEDSDEDALRQRG